MARRSAGPPRRACSTWTAACTSASAARCTRHATWTTTPGSASRSSVSDDYRDRGVAAVIERMRARLGDGPVYVSIDIDVLDPAHAPGTGTPEAGGLTSRELLHMLRGLAG